MGLEECLPLLMFVALFAMILTGFPVAFTLAGTAFFFGLLGYWLDLFYFSDFGFIPGKVFDGVVKNVTLIAVPLFIFMGVTLEKSGIAEDLLETMEQVFRNLRGGLTVSLIFVGALLAASTGIVGATVVTMGVLSLPTMLSRNYNKELSCGTIAAAGTLGQIIPPSIVLVLLGDQMNIPVGDLFVAAIFPGLLLVGLYSTYVLIRTHLNPSLAPLPEKESGWDPATLRKRVVRSIIPPVLLIGLVLGTILFGIASPTESAACGAVGALALAIVRRKLTRDILNDVMHRTTSMTSMVFTLLIGAQFFSVVFRGLSGDELIENFITELAISPHWILLAVMALIFFLGFFLDFLEICFIVVPIIAPLLITELEFNGLWLAILIAINLQTSFLTPPFGFALFYLKGVCPPGITTLHIYRGIIPFVVIQIVAMIILWIFPGVVTWLPELIFEETGVLY